MTDTAADDRHGHDHRRRHGDRGRAKGELVIDAAERAGVYIPRFCYHPRMQPVGMCRMCIVEIDTGRGPALQPSCMIPVARRHEGRHRVATVTKKAQDGVLEFLLINHPLDCPVCDKGGECPLQDQTHRLRPGRVAASSRRSGTSRSRSRSATSCYLDRERCILCDRCTRFAKEVAGDPLIHFHGPRQPDRRSTPSPTTRSPRTSAATPCRSARSARSPPRRTASRPGRGTSSRSSPPARRARSGCRVVDRRRPATRCCATRASTSTRSTGAGCATRAASTSRRSTATTASARRSCASRRRARAGHAGPRRSARPPAPSATALDAQRARRRRRLGGARLTNEAAYAWAKLAKGVIGTDNVDAQLGDGLPADVVLGPAPGDHRRGLRARRHGPPARPRPEGGAAGPVPAAAPRGRRATG